METTTARRRQVFTVAVETMFGGYSEERFATREEAIARRDELAALPHIYLEAFQPEDGAGFRDPIR